MTGKRDIGGRKRERFHVIPFAGPKHNVVGDDCWCLPKIEPYSHADLVIHNEYAAGIKAPKEC